MVGAQPEMVQIWEIQNVFVRFGFSFLNELSKARRKRIHSTSASCQPARERSHL